MNAIAKIVAEPALGEPRPAVLAELIAKAGLLYDTAVRLQATPYFDNCQLHRERELKRLHRDMAELEAVIREARHA